VREKGGGPAGLNGPEVEIWAAAGRRKRDGVGLWARMRNMVWFYFILFLLFNLLFKKSFKVFKKDLLNHTINKSPCIQHDEQTLGYFLN
jgi:hypothetical protein